MVKGRLPHRIKHLHAQYGDIVRVAPDELSFIDPAAWRDIYPKNFLRPNEYKDQPPGKTAANLIACTETEHVRFRKVLAPGFSERYVMEQESIIQGYIDQLINKINGRIAREAEAEGKGTGKTTLDVVEWINYVAFDIIGDLTWGSSFGCLDGLTYHPWIQTVSQFKTALAVAATKFYPIVNRGLMAITPPSALKDVMEMWKVTEQKVRQRVERGGMERPDFVSIILAAAAAASKDGGDGGKGESMTQEEMEVNAMMIVAAGSESVTTVLAGVINYLLRNPEKLATLTHEIRATFRAESEITGAALKNCSYLNAVLNEGMRLCPTIPDSMRRLVPARGAIVCGQALPADTVVSIPPWASYRSRRNFGRPDEFLPERWISPDQEGKDDSKIAFNPFCLGPHNCPGQNLAWLELRLILARLIWGFDMSIPPGVELPSWEEQGIWWFWDKMPTLVSFSQFR
jgi:cytochrome P450